MTFPMYGLRCWLWVTVALAGVSAAVHAAPATIAFNGTRWTLENDVLRTIVSCTNGSIGLVSFYNKTAAVEYLKGQGTRHLFKHLVEGQTLAANDGGWIFAGSAINEIHFHEKHWGSQLAVTVTRPAPPRLSVRLVFEIYDGPAGLRYYSFLRNDDATNTLTVGASDVLALDFPDQPHTLYHVPDNTLWASTTNGLPDGRRNCIVRYDAGHGWAINPENNFCTSIEPGQFKGSYDHTFLHINAWSAIDHVRVQSDPVAVQLVLFPKEEVEYFSVNLEVFRGDIWDGRVAVSQHLRRRFKFNPARMVSINDWQWFTTGKRTDAYYRETAVPAAVEAGLDRVHVDDFWNGNGSTFLRDSDQPLSTFTTNLPALGAWTEAQGVKLGLWFQPSGSGTTGWGAWGGGRDMADPAEIALKTDQVENMLIAKYRSFWAQVDCGLFYKGATNTSYSHTSDSVYRKVLNTRHFMNYFAGKYPDFIMQTTCEVDNPSNFGRESVGLLHLPDNGVAGLFRRTESHDNVKDMFNCIGLFPLEGMLETYGEDKQDDVWRAKTGWYYEWLLGRHTSIYYNLDSLTPEVRHHMRQFNDWRKSPRIHGLLDGVVLPLYNGKNSDNSGPWAWMFANAPRTAALVFAVGGANRAVTSFNAPLRWLDPGQTYLVEDVTLQDDGSWHYSFLGKFPGATLARSGLPIHLLENPSRGKAFWLQALSSQPQQVLYADDRIATFSETWDGQALTVRVSGQPSAIGTVVVYKSGPDAAEIRSITLDQQGRGQVRFSGNATTPNPVEPPVIAPGSRTFGGSLEITLSSGAHSGAPEIHYTFDGTKPTRRSPAYSGPIRIGASATLQAVAFRGEVSSTVASATYFGRGALPPIPNVPLSRLQPLRASVGWGDHPRLDRSIQDKPFSIAGVTYTNGIGTHAVSEMEYELTPAYTRFVAVVGIDDEMSDYTQSSVVFEVWIDGGRVAQSPVMRLGDFYYFDVPIPAGAKILRLVAGDAGDGFACDHADWANSGFLD